MSICLHPHPAHHIGATETDDMHQKLTNYGTISACFKLYSVQQSVRKGVGPFLVFLASLALVSSVYRTQFTESMFMIASVM